MGSKISVAQKKQDSQTNDTLRESLRGVSYIKYNFLLISRAKDGRLSLDNQLCGVIVTVPTIERNTLLIIYQASYPHLQSL